MTTPQGFCQLMLRTSAPEAARRFYRAVLNVDSIDALGEVTALPPPLRARGVPSHSLGHIGVRDLDAAATAATATGATLLGPRQRHRDGYRWQIIRDPQGAIYALREPAPTSPGQAAAWQALQTTDTEAAWRHYQGCYGWRAIGSHDIGSDIWPNNASNIASGMGSSTEPDIGAIQTFAWRAGDAADGAMLNSARLPGVHTHWLFFFQVDDLDRAIDTVRAHSGWAQDAPLRLPDGRRSIACEDPQRAAFGLIEPPSGS
ncbi:MAG: VOC family protein [Haliangiales bacterium]